MVARVLVAILAALPAVAAWAQAAESREPGGVDAPESVGSAEDPASSEGFFSRFIDPLDGRLDVTAGGSGGTSGFVPLVVPGNDPALGASLAAALVYFHPSEVSAEASGRNPPTMTGAGIGVTDKDSWAIAGAHSAVWKDGRMRYLGVLGAASVNLDYYGNEDLDFRDRPLGFNIEGEILVQQVQFRLGDSDLFAGVRYMFLSADVVFDVLSGIPTLGIGKNNDAGLSALLDYDSRDNTFTPNEGRRSAVALSYFSESLGGDFDYAELNASSFHYWRMREQRLTFGLRLEYDFTEEEAPFYALPWVSLRGIPLLRYYGNHVLTVEVEPRWRIDERWSVVGFAGVGRAAENFDELEDAEAAYNYGGGFRYLLARRLGLAGGIDVARGPEDTAIYLTFGNAWGL